MRHRSLRDPEHRVDVGLEGGIELLGRDTFNGLLRNLSRCIVHDDIKAAELLNGVVDELIAELLVPDVARQRDGFPSGRKDQLHHFACIGFLQRKIVDRDIRSFAGKGDRSGPAHA